MAAVKIQHKNCFQSTQRKKKNKRIICQPWSVRIGKNCELGLQYSPQPAASGHNLFLAQLFSIQTSRPANNIISILSIKEM